MAGRPIKHSAHIRAIIQGWRAQRECADAAAGAATAHHVSLGIVKFCHMRFAHRISEMAFAQICGTGAGARLLCEMQQSATRCSDVRNVLPPAPRQVGARGISATHVGDGFALDACCY